MHDLFLFFIFLCIHKKNKHGQSYGQPISNLIILMIQLGIGRQAPHISDCFLNISPSKVKSKLHIEYKPPSLLNNEVIYEE